jgi:hypothetical protein
MHGHRIASFATIGAAGQGSGRIRRLPSVHENPGRTENSKLLQSGAEEYVSISIGAADCDDKPKFGFRERLVPLKCAHRNNLRGLSWYGSGGVQAECFP